MTQKRTTKIAVPARNQPMKGNEFAWWFSDDLKDWTSAKKNSNERARERMRKYRSK